jgi:hypothetical protein
MGRLRGNAPVLEKGNYAGQPLRFGARRASVLLPFTLPVSVPAALSLRTRCFGRSGVAMTVTAHFLRLCSAADLSSCGKGINLTMRDFVL